MNFDRIKSFMDQLVRWKIPGNSICVYHRGKEVFSYQSGYADLEHKVDMTTEHLLNIYSCSKVVTVVAALQLYEKGLFGLDDPVYSVLPEYGELYVQSEHGIERAEKVMTIRQLFTMTSGLTYNMQGENFRQAWLETNGRMDTRTVIRHLAKVPLSFEPGEKWQYSLSHDVLACLVQVVSGQRFADYVKEHIFQPVGMVDAYYHNENIRERMAEQYCMVGEEFPPGGKVEHIGKENDLILGLDYDSGGAGITTSVKEFGKFCNALAYGETILKRETIELMRLNQLNVSQMQTFDWPHLRGYGYGLGVRTMCDGMQKEFGWGGAAGATVLIDPDEELAMFYAHHMLNPQEGYYQPRIRDILYDSMKK